VELDSEDKGGFGGGPMQLGHTATNYASCLALALIGTPAALEAVDRHALYRFFLSRKHTPTGAFTAHDGGCVHSADTADSEPVRRSPSDRQLTRSSVCVTAP
jgi:prenyltransferase beta subunit